MKIASIPSKYGGGNQVPDRIIIHSMGEFIDAGDKDYHAKEWLDRLRLSAHYLICPSGVIIQTRSDDRVAYHAKGHNLNTIGIEFLVSGLHTYGTFLKAIEKDYITSDQLIAGTELCRELSKKYSSPKIERHDLLDPDRKFDPGKGFPWEDFIQSIKS